MAERRSDFLVSPRGPFAFDLALLYLRTSPSTIVEVVGADHYRRALRLGGQTALLTVRAAPPGLAVAVEGPPLGQQELDEAAVVVRRIFATDDDPSPLYAAGAQKDPVFAALARRCYGLRPVQIPDLFETIVWAIIGQQINVQFAAKCKRALVERFGSRLACGGQDYLLFPTAARLARVAESELAAIQFSRQKIRYILNLAQEVAAGRLVLSALRDCPAGEALARLERLLGVGRWTAEYVLLRGLGHRDVIPAADGGLRRMIGQAYGLGRLASEAEVRDLARNWAGWRSYAAFYWWFAAQQEARRRAL